MSTTIQFKQILFAMAMAIALSACVNDRLLEEGGTEESGMVRIAVALNMPSGSVVTTRSTAPSTQEQNLSGNVVVMVFDSNDRATAKLKQAPASATVGSGNKLTALLKAETTKSYLCVVANIPETDKTYLLGLPAGTTLSDISSHMILTATEAGLSFPLPMSGWSGEVEKISKTDPQPITISLLRSVARIDVNGTEGDFTVHGVQLVNGAKSGWVLPQENLPYFDENNVISFDMQTLPTPNKVFTERLYCFENAGTHGNQSNPTRVVIKGQRAGVSSPSYYAIEIVYLEASQPQKERFDLERNKIYTIQLKKVESDGYSSYEEAAKSEAFNNQMVSDIVVTDPYAYSIVTNGKQYMGITNTEFVLYPISSTATPADLLVATLSYTCDPGWSEGTITATNGIVLTSNRLEVQHGSTQLYKDILVKTIPPGVNQGVIVAHIGNLRQEIKITVKAPTRAVGQIISDYFVAPDLITDFKVGEIISPTPETAWLKLSTSESDTGESALNDKITHPEGGVYVHVQPNIGFDNSARPREASLFVSGSDANQRIKVYVQQDKFDVYSGSLQLEPFTYVGTFHRWNQTAERLIRIDASSQLPGTDVWWIANVVAGREFIVLSTEKSLDGGINCFNNPYGIGDDADNKTDEAIEANCQVNSTLRTVQGSSSDIYFKVGLTGQLSGPAAAPRYGLITLTYGKGADTYGTHNIYVRQGEAADYLMRPWDPSTDPIDPKSGMNTRPNEFPSNTRPKAVKFGVYNLTNTTPHPASSPNEVDWGARGYDFVQYPSQGGYYFLASSTQAITPTVTLPLLSELSDPHDFSINSPWQTAWETCPRGYRRPDDGKARATINIDGNPIEYADDIENSEVRQSLWLFPLHTMERSDFSNQLRGYLADGFFDRRPIEIFGPDANPTGITRGIVEKGSKNAAYWGFLVFNPHNYASIFAPLNGSYRETGTYTGGTGQGQDGYFHTRTAGGGSDDGWMVAFGYFKKAGFEGYVFDSYQKSDARTGYAVRCIKDEQPAVGTDDPQVEVPGTGGSALVINISYQVTPGGSQILQQLIESKYTEAERKQANTIAINAQTTMSNADYTYLNDWSSKSDHQLRHLVIRGTETLPANAFTSSNWYTISCVDARQIDTGAFAASLSSLKELSLPYLDAMTVGTGAFAFSTSGVQLYLDGKEYGNRIGNEWRGVTWKGIKKYK